MIGRNDTDAAHGESNQGYLHVVPFVAVRPPTEDLRSHRDFFLDGTYDCELQDGCVEDDEAGGGVVGAWAEPVADWPLVAPMGSAILATVERNS